MVRIDRLEMQGFKSFTRKTLISFPDNFSVICGPNGSGKSNVLDAICFVLGRTSAKSIRADKMTEVIFNGASGKPPAEFAKVGLIFDNSDKTFPFEDDKVKISRKVNRRGVSIYKVNGNTVTRESMLEVLRSANIFPDGHNIILQGDITEIIEMSPIGRREIIDEISGIREFDEKRDKAKRELETVETRVRESAAVLDERKKTLDKMETDRRSAKEYKTTAIELDKLRASLAKKKLSLAEEAMQKMDEKIEKFSSEEFDKKMDEIDKEIEVLEKTKKDIEDGLFDRSKGVIIIKELENVKSDIITKQNKIDTMEFEIKRIDDMIKNIQIFKERERHASTSDAVKEILKLKKTGIYGTVASLSKVKKEYQTAIEVTAGNHLEDVITADKDIAIECVNFLKRNKIGRAMFLPLDKIKERDSSRLSDLLNEDGVIGIAMDLVEFDKKYWHAFSFIFGETLIVDKIETARKIGIGKARFVTLDGDLVERSGAIVGGFYRPKHKLSDSVDDTKKYEDEKIRLRAEIDIITNAIEKLKEKLKSVSTKEEAESSEALKFQKDRQEMIEKLNNLRSVRSEVYGSKTNAQEEIQRLRIRKARLEAELENLKLEFTNYSKYETYSTIEIPELERRIKTSLETINSLGAINMKALEEYDELKKQYDDLKEKIERLIKERETVIKIMLDIEGRRRETFTKTLSEISEHFKTVFFDLMRGGEGLIELENPEDIESGLLVNAKPSGRKKLNIDSMSGGEKTMTALAFLFAIQKFRPAPFYILDEIDAALDKKNATKMVDLIKNYSDKAQFVIISHNDLTVQEGKCVYGVSMQEGESRIIGIKMPE